MLKIVKFLALVVGWLTVHGTTPDRLKAKGLGQSKPVAVYDKEEGRAKISCEELVRL